MDFENSTVLCMYVYTTRQSYDLDSETNDLYFTMIKFIFIFQMYPPTAGTGWRETKCIFNIFHNIFMERSAGNKLKLTSTWRDLIILQYLISRRPCRYYNYFQLCSRVLLLLLQFSWLNISAKKVTQLLCPQDLGIGYRYRAVLSQT